MGCFPNCSKLFSFRQSVCLRFKQYSRTFWETFGIFGIRYPGSSLCWRSLPFSVFAACLSVCCLCVSLSVCLDFIPLSVSSLWHCKVFFLCVDPLLMNELRPTKVPNSLLSTSFQQFSKTSPLFYKRIFWHEQLDQIKFNPVSQYGKFEMVSQLQLQLVSSLPQIFCTLENGFSAKNG